MTELITDHTYLRGPYGRCASGLPPCNRHKAAHGKEVVGPTGVHPGSWDVIAATHFPGTVPDAPPPKIEWLPVAGRTIYVRRKPHANPIEEIRADWPADWPLPRVGDLVRVNDRTDLVKDITFDLDRKRIILAC